VCVCVCVYVCMCVCVLNSKVCVCVCVCMCVCVCVLLWLLLSKGALIAVEHRSQGIEQTRLVPLAPKMIRCSCAQLERLCSTAKLGVCVCVCVCMCVCVRSRAKEPLLLLVCLRLGSVAQSPLKSKGRSTFCQRLALLRKGSAQQQSVGVWVCVCVCVYVCACPLNSKGAFALEQRSTFAYALALLRKEAPLLTPVWHRSTFADAFAQQQTSSTFASEQRSTFACAFAQLQRRRAWQYGSFMAMALSWQ